MIDGLPERYTARSLRPADDLDAVLGIVAAADVADVGFEDSLRSIIEDNWRSLRFHPDRDAVLIFGPDGSAVAEVECTAEADAVVESFGRVHPAHRGRGLGTCLIGWSERRARGHGSAGAKQILQVSAPAEDRSFASLVLGRGYRRARVFQHMERPLQGLAAAPPSPDGIEIRSAVVPDDLPELHDVMETAFSDHFGFVPMDFERWRTAWLGYPGADPRLFLLAWDGSDLAGAAMSSEAGPVGWVGDVSVLKAWRRRGIGEALMYATFAALAEQGFAEARLNVDAENESGAVRLYERVGMTVRRTWHVYEKALAGG